MSYGATESELDPLTAGSKDPEDGSSKSVFVDYTPPADAKILPPAKHKLLFLAWVLVYAANYVALERMIPFLCFNGWASVDFALFLYLGIVVIVLVYGALDLSVGLLTFERNGKVYGLGAWLKQPRMSWLYKYENVFAESLAGIIHIAEDGFAMFDAPPKEETRAEPKTYHPASTDTSKQLELRVEHLIPPEKLEKYAMWKAKIGRVAKREATGLKISDHAIDTSKRTTTEDGVEAVLCCTTLLFDDIEAMNEWQLSPIRAVLIEEVQELLVVPDVERLRAERVLPDAFTDIVARQGVAAPPLPPKKWKVSWLLTMSLFVCIKWEAHMMAYYYEFWGWKENHPVLQSAVSLAIVIFLNDYITVPLLLFLFDPWMLRKKSEGPEDREPWKTINDGFTSMAGQSIITLIFFLPNIVAMVK